MLYPTLRKLASALRQTPLHPQWLVFLREKRNLKRLSRDFNGRILDIGCAGQRPRRYLPAHSEYIGLDYYSTATRWYQNRPQVYANAQTLPFPDSSMDGVLLLDVMEHLPAPEAALGEIFRVLKPSGHCMLLVPFLYPIHDAPLDFQRWTLHGLRVLATRHGLAIREESAQGHALETAALLANLAVSKTLLDAIRCGNPVGLLALFLPLLIPACNLIAWVLARIAPRVDFMPFGYCLILTKPA
ncbi:MAG: class I SAM-dependent methyltransferase [Sulfuricaulis sp.]